MCWWNKSDISFQQINVELKSIHSMIICTTQTICDLNKYVGYLLENIRSACLASGVSIKPRTVPYFTDEEHRILLSALAKEKKLCEKFDTDFGTSELVSLVEIVDNIERKVSWLQHPEREITNE